MVAVWPTSPGQVSELATEAVRDGLDMVVALGGDGVVHHVAGSLVGTSTVLGVIPVGTTNVMARILDLPRRPKAAARFLASDPPTVDSPVARISGQSGAGPIASFGIFATGIGFDAEVIAVAEREPYRKYRFGGVHYARTATVLTKDISRRPANMRVTDGSRQLDAVSVIVQLHHPYTYFGMLPLRVTDRAPRGLSVLIVERLSVLRAPTILLRAARGRNLGDTSGLSVWEDVTEVTIYAEPKAPLQADGELLGLASTVTISASPDRLRIASPKENSVGS